MMSAREAWVRNRRSLLLILRRVRQRAYELSGTRHRFADRVVHRSTRRIRECGIRPADKDGTCVPPYKAARRRLFISWYSS